ncbi:MAG: Smr/MutS family protein [Hyphomicrobiaceae bacterium]|nr:Smr/MutS family protein [Hyphomicrobiaceae bacterium]
MTTDDGDTGKPKTRRRSRPVLSDDDVAVWQHTARSLEPLRGAKSRIVRGHDDESLLSPPRPQLRHDLRIATARDTTSSTRSAAACAPGTPPTPKVPGSNESSTRAPPLSAFDQKSARRLRSGRKEIEGRLDLHGFRQNEAHAALRSFLWRAHDEGKRWVLVITGKGGPVRAGMLRSDPDTPEWMVPERGVLRRSVPRWLGEPELRTIVVSYTSAAIHHGGDGAMYIQLRARRA